METRPGRKYARSATALNQWRDAEPQITQEAMARIAGVTLYTAHKWCVGDSEPRLGHVRRLEAHRPGLLLLIYPRLLGNDESATG